MAVAKNCDVHPMLKCKILVGTASLPVHFIDIIDQIEDVPARRHGTHQY